MPDPFATQEPPDALWFEQTNNASVYIGAIAYGAHIVIFFMCAYYLVQERKKGNWRWLSFIALLFALGTINVVMNIHFNELAWIDERNYPGGPLAFILEQQSIKTNIAGNAVSAVVPFLADGLLIYRVHVVWNRWWMIVIPILAWLASFAMGILTTVQAAEPQSSLWADGTLNFSVPYFSLSMALNIFLTILLVSRLMYMRHKITSTLGAQYGKTYTGIATMVLESALPYGLTSLVFIVLYAIHNTAANLLLPLLVQVECISPMLIILRVSRGRAWSNDTVSEAQLSKMRFGSGGNGSTTAGGSHRNGDTSLITFRAGSNSQLRSKESYV
ncbi:unnamed protein product [Somion occarium]|uniref:Uncharacterized protein n=1 Tax=Somion occarium TaxID=3059160 RepID=A0ABP1CNL8_9APHY